VPGDFEAALLRCLAKNPDDRYPDALSLQDALAQCAERNPWSRSEASSWWSDFNALKTAQRKGPSKTPDDSSQVPATIGVAEPFSRG
jgi:hypothetical protein